MSEATLTLTRAIAAPLPRVYAAWTTSEALDHWWGPDGYRASTVSHRFEEGGSWHFRYAHADKGSWDEHIVYRTIEPLRRIVWESLVDGEPVHRGEARFRGEGDHTTVELTVTFPSEEVRDQLVRDHQVDEGGAQTLARLGLLAGDDGDGRTRLAVAASGPDRIVISRFLHGSPERVFAAFTDPALIPQWMSTPDFPMQSCEVQAEVGGRFRYTWGETTATMGVTGTFVELERPRRLVHTEVFDEDWTGGEVTVTTTFLPMDGGTTVVMDLLYRSTEARDAVLGSPMRFGLDHNYLGLDDLLAFGPVDPERDLVLTREVPVSCAQVWAAWTRPELLVQWFTPAPWSTVAAEVDLRPGGLFRTVMADPEGQEQPAGDGCYLDVVPERRLVWTDALLPGFRPKGSGFMTAGLFLRPSPQGTHYRVVVRHTDPEKKQEHEDMGFYAGWGAALDQLVELMG